MEGNRWEVVGVLAGMEETRHRFHEALTELEQKVLDGFELVIEQLDRALESIGCRDVELAARVVADDVSNQSALQGGTRGRAGAGRAANSGRG
jgi:hypothetical protein